jgi:glycosyltransferase involved in cell wall biosynthesis
MKKYIIVDCKNFPFYSSGISGYFKPFLKASIQYFNEYTFVLTSPAKFDTNFLDGLTNYECRIIPNLKSNFKFLNILIYDFYIYPNALKKINGIMLLSPYYDFIIPKCYKDKAIITVHDLCYWEVGNCYSLKVKLYHKFLLYINSSRAKKIITVSKTSLFYIKKYFNNEILKKCKIIYNVFEPTKNNNLSIHNVNLKKKIILYTGGYEQRKNIELLFKVLNDLKHEIDFELVFTGNFNNNNSLIQLIDNYELNNIVKLTGIIDTQELKNLYLKWQISSTSKNSNSTSTPSLSRIQLPLHQ